MRLRQVINPSFAFDRAHFEPGPALRCTAGVAVPLFVGLLFNQGWIAAFGAIGAVSVGFGSFQGAYRSRAEAMLYASIGMGTAVFLGSLTAGFVPGATALAAVAAFASGYFVALGAAASYVALQCGIAAIIAGGLPAPAHIAVLRGGVVFVGGLVQTLLVVSVWPLRRFSTERAATASVYTSLASYARGIGHADVTAPEPHTLATTLAPADDPHPMASAGDVLVFQALFDEAERIRASLAGLAIRQELTASHETCFARLTHAIGDALSEIAEALLDGHEPRDIRAAWEAIDACVAELSGAVPVDALLGQLRAAWRVAGVLSAASRHPSENRLPPLRYRPPVGDALTTLRANLTLESSACRHAIRVAAAVALATVGYQALNLNRGYWIPMTALIVLRPDFYETFARGLARIGGTLLGAALATAVVHLIVPTPAVLAVSVLVCVWGCYSLFRVNYALFTVCLTGYVVFILMLGGVTETAAATTRALYTLEGGLFAVIVYAIWPTWAGRTARSSMAALLDAHGAYVDALLSAYVDPSTLDRDRLARLRSDARLQRSNTEALIDRMNVEPVARASIDRKTAIGLLAALRRHALAALALHAGLESGNAHRVSGAKELLADMRVAFAELAGAVRTGNPPAALPPLRKHHAKVASDPAIGIETDLMVDSLNTMAELLAARANVKPERTG